MNGQSKYFENMLHFNLMLVNSIGRGFAYNRLPATPHIPQTVADQTNPLRAFFNARKQGRGIWKWEHYFDIYDRHFRRFRGREGHVLEIGVYSGGSLDMWADYFGPGARVYGVDIAPACKSYENATTKIFIGDQADRKFWSGFREKVPALDIVIDDGGHHPEQQIATFEELLPHLRPGGIFLCEDVHGAFNPFASYMHGVAHKLNDFEQVRNNTEDMDRRIVCPATPFQAAVGSVHFYPFVTVVERNATPVAELIAPKHGTQWQPHLK
jgi:SAM-dependent methyltransferase